MISSKNEISYLNLVSLNNYVTRKKNYNKKYNNKKLLNVGKKILNSYILSERTSLMNLPFL